MQKFITAKLFLTLQEASQKNADADERILKRSYNGFAGLLFSEDAAAGDKMAYRNELVYTRAELAGLTGVSGEKCGSLSPQSH